MMVADSSSVSFSCFSWVWPTRSATIFMTPFYLWCSCDLDFAGAMSMSYDQRKFINPINATNHFDSSLNI